MSKKPAKKKPNAAECKCPRCEVLEWILSEIHSRTCRLSDFASSVSLTDPLEALAAALDDREVAFKFGGYGNRERQRKKKLRELRERYGRFFPERDE